MKRKDFLKNSIGLIGMSAILPALTACKKEGINTTGVNTGTDSTGASNSTSGDCVIAPEETAGPYPYDLSSNSAIFRTNITEGKTGVPLNLSIDIVNVNDHCNPVENARVDIWHCDKDGYYSEYSEPGYLGNKDYKGETFLRGIQLSDSNGQVKFTTIYPGWYSGRVTHIHVEVFIDNVLKKTTQIAFPDDINNAVYKTSLYAAHGENSSVANNTADMVFGNSATDLEHEICTLTANADTGGYDAAHTIGIAV